MRLALADYLFLLQFRDAREQVNEDSPELLKELFELSDFIICAAWDFGFVVASDDAGGDGDNVLQAAEYEAIE